MPKIPAIANKLSDCFLDIFRPVSVSLWAKKALDPPFNRIFNL
jgi:hypothetical protein